MKFVTAGSENLYDHMRLLRHFVTTIMNYYLLDDDDDPSFELVGVLESTRST